MVTRCCSPFSCTTICFSPTIVICFQYTTNLQPILSYCFIYHATMYCLFFSIYQCGACAGQYIATLLYAALDPRAMLHQSCNSGVFISLVHIGVFCHWFFFLHFSNRAASWDNHKLHSIFNDLHLLINLLGIHIKLLLICCT